MVDSRCNRNFPNYHQSFRSDDKTITGTMIKTATALPVEVPIWVLRKASFVNVIDNTGEGDQ